MFDGREKRGEEKRASATIACWELGTGLKDTRMVVSRYPVGRFNKTGGPLNKKKPCRNMGFNLMDMYVTSMGPFPRRLSAFLRSTTYGP